MKLDYNVTGAERKSLASAICQELNAPMKYLGMPSAAYEIGGYTIDKTGMVTGGDDRELVEKLSALHGFTAVSVEYDAPPAETKEGRCFEDLEMTEREELGLGQRHGRQHPGVRQAWPARQAVSEAGENVQPEKGRRRHAAGS